ncbi:MAG: EAL domain-containing protein [Solibacillus sp.]
MTVDIGRTTSSLVEIIKNLGEQSNKAYLIVECADHTYPIIYHNNKYRELTQFTTEEIEQKAFQSIFLQNHSQPMTRAIQHNLQAGKMFEMELVQVKKQGTFCSRIECLPFGKDYYLVLIEDITISQLTSYMDRLAYQIFLSIEKNMKFHEQISLICSEIDEMFSPYSYTTITLELENKLVTMLSNRFTTFKRKQFMLTNERELTFYTQVIQKNQILQIEDFGHYPINENLKLFLLQHNYSNCWLIPIMNHDEVIGVMTVFFDVQKRPTRAYEQSVARLLKIIATCYELNKKQLLIQQLAYIDQATSLPNLHHFKRTLKGLKKKGKYGVVKIVEASEFSKIVELYGRGVGDKLLKEIGERLKQTSTSKVFHIARYTSSSLIIFSTRDFNTVRVDPTPFLHIIASPFEVNGTNTYITLKSGFAAFDKEVSCENSIRFAEVALEKAKKTAGTQTEYYEGHMDVVRQREMQILNYLTEAIQKKEIETYFQPKMTLYRERIASVEALARWHSKELGFVSPVEFIPVAENAGLICDIDLLMLEQILQWMQRRLYAGKKIIPVAINISPTHFYHPDFVMNMKRLIGKYYIDPHYLIVEVTESIGLSDLKRAKMILRDLHRLGVKTSVDDFGIGYSSLSYLQKFSFQELKIDRSFISNLHEMGTFAIVKAIIQVAHTLQMTVTAEGVETKEQVEILKKLRCDIAQGYYYHKPMMIKNFEQIFDLK